MWTHSLLYINFMPAVIPLADIKDIDLSCSKRIDMSCLCCEPLSPRSGEPTHPEWPKVITQLDHMIFC